MSDLLPQFLLVAGGVGALYFGAEYLVRGAARLAQRFGVSPIVIGLTVVSLGTSAPELTVSLVAALSGRPDVAVGNVLGSNLANIGLVLALTAIIRPLSVHAQVVRREIPVMFVFTLVVFPLLLDLQVSRGDGTIMFGLLVAYLIFLLRASGDETAAVRGEFEEFVGPAPTEEEKSLRAVMVAVGMVLAGGVGLVIGGTSIVEGATAIAEAFGVPDLLIGMSAIAVGTSLPELATSVVAAMKDEADIAVGNVVGSNIFNLGAVLGLTSMVEPITVAPSILTVHYPAVLLLSLLLLPFARTRMTVGRVEGAFLFFMYIVGGIWVFTQ